MINHEDSLEEKQFHTYQIPLDVGFSYFKCYSVGIEINVSRAYSFGSFVIQ